ncbi:flavin mononucleotide-binding protein [Kriegella sp. EG-1]|nr:flavin mononucleotide-binding protein [Flavobacteriaceae bacterium EG-1]
MITDLGIEECKEFLSKNYLGHLGYISGKDPFVTTITLFYDASENSILSYAAIGHKIMAMRNNNRVTLHVENVQSIQEWSSVLIHGIFEEIEGSAAKKYLHKFAQGVQDTIEKLKGEKPKFISDFSGRLQKRDMPIIYRIKINGITGKIRTLKT